MMHEMTSRERLLCAMRGGQPDRVPLFEWPFSLELYDTFLGYRPASYNGQDAARVGLKIGLDGIAVADSAATGYEPDWIDGKRYRDEWGVLRQVDPAAWPLDAPIGPAVETLEALLAYEGPDPWAPGRTKELENALEEAKGRMAIVGCIDGPFTRPWFIAGMERFMLLCYDAPDIIEHLIEVCTDFAIIQGRRLVEAGADALIIADDLGHKTGPFLSLRQFHRYVLPEFRREMDELKKLDVPIILHSCGDVNLYLPDLVDAGIDGLNPLQRTAGMDLEQVKKTYGNQICLVGNINASETLPYGSPEEVEQEVIEALRVAAPGGGYVMASDHSLHCGIPVPNIMTMIETTRRCGQYPIKPYTC